VEINRRIVTRFLSACTLDVNACDDGEAALAELERAAREGQPYDVAILDYHLPGIDGGELACRIKSTLEIASTHLLMLTSVGHRGEAGRFREWGIAALLVKPVQQDELHEALCVVCGGGRSLPREATPPAEIRGRQPAGAGVLLGEDRPPRVLVAEDNPVNQRLTHKMLKKLGCAVVTVANGRDAVRRAAAEVFDVVLMDCQMPEMGGYEATAAIRALAHCRSLPIIALTAHAMQGDRERCLRAGMNDYMTKPVRLETLTQVLSRWLPAGKQVIVSS
jgi:CheY-like chemotaxis protein